MASVELNKKDILKNHGGVAINNFKDIIDSLDSSDEIELVKLSPYYSPNNMPAFIKKTDAFSILSLNVQCLNAKLPGIKIMLEIFTQQGIRFPVLCFQETWLDELSDTEYNRFNSLDGYTLLTVPRRCSPHGGLAIYYDNCFDAKIIELSKSEVWEGMFVRITNINQKEKAVVGNIYRVPKNQNSTERLDTFINELPPFLDRLNKPKQEVYLAGDYNINLLKINEESRYADFFDTMATHSFFPHITLPTRLASKSSTLIDNIFSKVSPSMINSKSGIIVTALSDHFPVFITSDRISSRSRKPPSHVQMRVNNQEAKQNMLTELTNMDISINCKSFLTIKRPDVCILYLF